MMKQYVTFRGHVDDTHLVHFHKSNSIDLNNGAIVWIQISPIYKYIYILIHISTVITITVLGLLTTSLSI